MCMPIASFAEIQYAKFCASLTPQELAWFRPANVARLRAYPLGFDPPLCWRSGPSEPFCGDCGGFVDGPRVPCHVPYGSQL